MLIFMQGNLSRNYVEQLKSFSTSKSFLGMICGVGSRALYMYSLTDSLSTESAQCRGHVIDPHYLNHVSILMNVIKIYRILLHTLNFIISSQRVQAKDRISAYIYEHDDKSLTIPIELLDPSMAIGFMCRDPTEYDEFVALLTTNQEKYSMAPIVTFNANEREIDMSNNWDDDMDDF